MERTRLQIEAAAGGTTSKVSGEAYLGGKLRVGGWIDPVVVDLSGMAIADNLPLLVNHENRTASRLGLIDASVANGIVRISGEVVSSSGVAQGIIEQAAAGAEWQLSIGVDPLSETYVRTGTAEINGQTHEAPFYHVTRSVLSEVSVVPVGADAGTRMRISAMHLSRGPLNASAAQGGTMDPTETKVETPSVPAETKIEAKPVDPAIAAAAAVKAERERTVAIKAACANEYPEIEAQAIRDEWTADQTRAKVLEAVRASRPAGISTARRADDATAEVIEAACLLAGRAANPEKHVSAQSLDTAAKRYRHGLGMQQLIIEAARANGYTGNDLRVNREIMQFAFGDQRVIRAGFSTVDISGLLSNVANKFLLQGFLGVENAWRQIASIRAVRDFKQITSYRLTGASMYELVGPGGEIPHGTLGEESYTNQAKTYGLMLSITRQDIINDDLGALTSVPAMLGRAAGTKFNDIFWTEWLDDSTFFPTNGSKNNYISGAATNLSIDGLSTGYVKFMKQVDANSLPLGVSPSILLTPPETALVAAQLRTSMEMRNPSAKDLVANPHAGKYTNVVSSYLSNSSYTGYSTTAWYLLANPMDLSAVEVAFLNGQESPTVEQADAEFDTLGIKMRGYHDFGVTKQDYRAGVKSKGAA